jgi:hypothetical protein
MNDPESTSKNLQADQFEEQVMRSLRRIEAPKGFAARVLQRAAASEKPLPLRPRFRRGLRWGWIGAVVAILVLVALVANQVRVSRERARVAQIQAQFDTAMRVTDGALAQTRAELERMGLKFGE